MQAAIAHQGRSLLRRILPRLPQANSIPTLEEIVGYNIQNPKIPALGKFSPHLRQSVPMTGSNVGESTSHMQARLSSTNLSGAADAYQPAAAYLRRKPATLEWISANSAGNNRHGGIPLVGANTLL